MLSELNEGVPHRWSALFFNELRSTAYVQALFENNNSLKGIDEQKGCKI